MLRISRCLYCLTIKVYSIRKPSDHCKDTLGEVFKLEEEWPLCFTSLL